MSPKAAAAWRHLSNSAQDRKDVQVHASLALSLCHTEVASSRALYRQQAQHLYPLSHRGPKLNSGLSHKHDMELPALPMLPAIGRRPARPAVCGRSRPPPPCPIQSLRPTDYYI